MNRYDTKRLLTLAIFLIISTLIFGYIYFAFRDYIRGPFLSITSPENGSTVATSTAIIRGKALRIKDISINGRPILIDREGNFAELVLLAPGYNPSLIKAIDKFNRTIEYKLELVY